MSDSAKKLISAVLENYGLKHHGFTELNTPLSLHFYEDWLNKDLQADMKYLKDHLPFKKEPQKLRPRAQSAIVFSYPYHEPKPFRLEHLHIAAYARREDYHYWLQEKIQQLCADLSALFPQEEFVGFTDSAPVLERDLAHRAGLGWFGKNTCMIDRKKGSFFFIGEIYTSLNLSSPETLSPDHCGTCRRCLEACPTQAFTEPRVLDAKRCIAYWTIEAKDVPPEPLREKFGDWFFGCDVCQDVCPWNHKIIKEMARPALSSEGLIQELHWILSSSNKTLMRALHKTPLVRAGGRGLKRNALILIANMQLQELKPQVETFLEDERLGELAQWTYRQLENKKAR